MTNWNEEHTSKMRELNDACTEAGLQDCCPATSEGCGDCPHNPCTYCKEHKLYTDPFDPIECVDCEEEDAFIDQFNVQVIREEEASERMRRATADNLNRFKRARGSAGS